MGDEDETKKYFCFDFIEISRYSWFDCYLPSKETTSSNAQIINAINPNPDDSTPVATNPQNTSFPIT